MRRGNKLITNWFRKPTCSGRYINFFSSHPIKHKINTIYNLIDHALLLSDDQFHRTNIEMVKNILINNSFPKQFINKYVNRRINILKNDVNGNSHNSDNSDNSESRPEMTRVIPLPYVEGVSDDIKRSLKNVNLNVVYCLPKKLNTMIKRGKDKLSTCSN